MFIFPETGFIQKHVTVVEVDTLEREKPHMYINVRTLRVDRDMRSSRHRRTFGRGDKGWKFHGG